MKILDLLGQPEGKTLEFKRDLSAPAGVLRTITAFANTAGGVLIVGVEDQSHHVRGLPDPLNTEERLANLISDRIHPRLVPDLEVVPWRRTYLLAVRVHPSPIRPHLLTLKGGYRNAYVRVGSTNRAAGELLTEEMRRTSRRTGFDEEAMPGLNSEAIDFRAASELFEPIRTICEKDLVNLGLLTTHQGRKVPTVGGMLLFGCDRDAHFPDAWIHVGCFEGTNRSRIIDQQYLLGSLIVAIDDAISFVQKHSLRGVEIGTPRSSDRWSVPMIAVREALVNAVVHADYSQQGGPVRLSMFSDRLEVESPGLLPFGLTIDDLSQGVSKLRNRVLGRVFHELGLVERWGSGIGRMAEACRETGLAPPVFEEIGFRFRVTLSLLSIASPPDEDMDQTILEALSDGSGLRTSEVASVIGLSTRATRTRLARLVARGLVREVGTSRRDPRRKYFKID